MLDSQIIDIPLQGGLAENVDPRLVPMGAWLKLENCRRPKKQGLTGRFGTVAVTRSILSGGNISSCVAMGALDSTLILLDGTRVLSRSDNSASWINRSSTLDTNGIALNLNTFPTSLAHRTIYGTSNRVVTLSQCRSSDGLMHYAWEQVQASVSDHAIYDLVIDETSQTIVRGPQLIDAIGYAPRVMNCNGKIVCVYSNGTATPATIKARSKPTTTSAYSGATNLITDQYTVQANSVWDAQSFGGASNNFVLSYESSLLNGLHTNIYSSAFVLQAGAVWGSVASDYRAVACNPISGEGIWVAVTRDIGGIIKIEGSRLSDTTAVQQFAPVIIVDGVPLGLATGSFGTPGRLTIGRTDSTHATVIGSWSESLPVIPGFYRNWIDSAGTIGTVVIHGGYQAVSRLFMGADNRQYIFISDFSYLDSTPTGLARSLYLLDTEASFGEQGSGRIVSRGPMRLIDSTINNFFMSRVCTDVIVNGNSLMFPCASLRQLNVSHYPIENVTLTFNDPARYKILQFAASAIIQPGQVFDRNKPVELGFHRIPSVPLLADGGAGALNAGKYGYISCLRHINSSGEVVRSSPSAAATITLAASHRANATSYFGSLTDRQARDVVATQPQTEYVVAEFYRTVANGSTYYLVGEVPLSTGGSSFGSAFFSDNVTDTVLQTKPILYTGSQAPNLSPPNLKSICVWQNRLIGLGPDNHTIWISSEYVAGEQVTFNEFFNCYVAQDFLTALGVVDDKLMAFSATNVYYIAGTPADSLGGGNTLQPTTISSDFGCTDPRAVVAHDEGLMFKSRRSFGIVTRGLGVEEIGWPSLEQSTTYPVVKATTDLDYDREVRFCMASTEASSTGIVLVYNSATQEWYVNKYYDSIANLASALPVASAQINGVWYAAFSNGSIIKEDQTLYTDSNQFVESVYGSPWIALDSVANYKRFKRVFIQAERITPHDLQVKLFNDGNETAAQTSVYTDGQIAAFPNLPNEQFMIHVGDQKSNLVRVELTVKNPSGSQIGTGQGIKLYGISLRVGVKKGFGSQAGEMQKE